MKARTAFALLGILMLLAPAAESASIGPYGTMVKISTTSNPHWMPTLTTTAPAMVYRDGATAANAGVLSTDDTVYLLLVNPADTTTVRAGDLIIGGSQKGTRVTTQVAASGTLTPVYCLVDDATADNLPNPTERVFIAFGADCNTGPWLPLSGTTPAPGTLIADTGTRPGSPTAATALGAAVYSYLDADANGNYNAADGVYLRFVALAVTNSHPATVDIRLTTVGSKTFGSRPVLGDFDARGVLERQITGLATSNFLWLDGGTGTVGAVDAGEILVLDVTGDGKTADDITLATGTGCTTLGAACASTSGTWTALNTASNSPLLCIYDAAPVGVFSTGDTLYIHFGAACTEQVATNDIRLTKFGTTAPGRVSASAEKVTLAVPPAIDAASFDRDADTTFTTGDGVYLLDQSISGAVTYALPGSFRLHTVSSLAYGQPVVESDKDVVLALTGSSAPVFASYDSDGSNSLSNDDAVYLLSPGTVGCAGNFVAADVRLEAGPSGGAAGTTIGSGFELGKARQCNVPGTADFAFVGAGSYSTSVAVYTDVNGNSQVDSIDLHLSSGGTAGTHPTTGLNAATTALGANVAFVDADANGAHSAGEAVVLDQDGDGFVSIGDIVLSTGIGTTTGGNTGGGNSGGGNTGGGNTGGGNTGGSATETNTGTTTETETETSTSTSTGGDGTTNTGNETGGTDAAPVPVALVLVALGAVALLARRRW